MEFERSVRLPKVLYVNIAGINLLERLVSRVGYDFPFCSSIKELALLIYNIIHHHQNPFERFWMYNIIHHYQNPFERFWMYSRLIINARAKGASSEVDRLISPKRCCIPLTSIDNHDHSTQNQGQVWNETHRRGGAKKRADWRRSCRLTSVTVLDPL